MVDLDDTIVEVHGHHKQGAAFGYSGVRGLNAILATVCTDTVAPVVVAQRLRKGSCGSSRGVTRLICDALATTGRTHLAGRDILVRADSALCRTRHKAESDRTVTCPVAPALRAVTSASATRRAAPLAEFVAPRRSRVAAITGAETGVETIASSAFKPLTLEYPYPAPCFR